jgi:hypothetical protein
MRKRGPSAEFVLTRIFFTIVGALVLSTGRAGAAEPSPPPEPKGLCEVVADARNHGRTVRLRGQYFRGFEKSYLADPGCKERVWVSWADGAGIDTEPARRMRAWGGIGGMPVVVEGVFHATGADGKRRGYGHLGAYPAMIEVVAVLEAGGKPAK